VPITTKVVSSNPAHGEVYSIQHYRIKFVRELQQVGGFLSIVESGIKHHRATNQSIKYKIKITIKHDKSIQNSKSN